MTQHPVLFWAVVVGLVFGGVGPFLAHWRWPLLQAPSLVPTLFALGVGSLTAVWTLVTIVQETGLRGRESLLAALVFQFILAVLAYGVPEFPVLIINGALDRTPVVPTRAVIHAVGFRAAEVRIVEGPFSGVTCSIANWNLPSGRPEFRNRAGASLTLMLHRGRLGYPWWESLQ